jgi:hypothetical protein
MDQATTRVLERVRASLVIQGGRLGMLYPLALSTGPPMTREEKTLRTIHNYVGSALDELEDFLEEKEAP